MDVTLRTRRLTLRPAQVADAPAVARYLNNFAVAGNLSRVPYPYSLKDAEWWLGGQRADLPAEQTGFAIELEGAGYVGQVGFHLDANDPTIGYWLGEPFWHRGLMTEAVRAAVEWYFGASEEPVIHSGVFAFNKASLAVQKKLGFTETGVSSRHCLARHQEVRHIDTQLSRTQWQEARA
jgi:RimJ/RimL family protein N-acetyltransferase